MSNFHLSHHLLISGGAASFQGSFSHKSHAIVIYLVNELEKLNWSDHTRRKVHLVCFFWLLSFRSWKVWLQIPCLNYCSSLSILVSLSSWLNIFLALVNLLSASTLLLSKDDTLEIYLWRIKPSFRNNSTDSFFTFLTLSKVFASGYQIIKIHNLFNPIYSFFKVKSIVLKMDFQRYF